jgi:hypothetical protein
LGEASPRGTTPRRACEGGPSARVPRHRAGEGSEIRKINATADFWKVRDPKNQRRGSSPEGEGSRGSTPRQGSGGRVVWKTSATAVFCRARGPKNQRGVDFAGGIGKAGGGRILPKWVYKDQSRRPALVAPLPWPCSCLPRLDPRPKAHEPASRPRRGPTASAPPRSTGLRGARHSTKRAPNPGLTSTTTDRTNPEGEDALVGTMEPGTQGSGCLCQGGGTGIVEAGQRGVEPERGRATLEVSRATTEMS